MRIPLRFVGGVLGLAVFSGCSSFSDEVYVYIGDDNRLVSLFDGAAQEQGTSQQSGASVSKSNDEADGPRPTGFRCTFSSKASKPSFFSQEKSTSGSLECRRLYGEASSVSSDTTE